MFKPEKYTPPKFDREPFISFPDVTTEKAGDGYIPENFYATTIYPEYFKINGEWKMLTGSRMDCSVVIKDGMPYAVEMRNIKKGDEVVVNPHGRRQGRHLCPCGRFLRPGEQRRSGVRVQDGTEPRDFVFPRLRPPL